MKKITSILLTMVLVLSLHVNTYAEQLDDSSIKVQNCVLDSFTGQQLDEISNMNITENCISFVYSGKNFLFPLQRLSIDTSDGLNISEGKFYSGNSNDLICNIVEYNDSYCIQVLDKTKSIEGRKNDPANNFTILVGNNVKRKLKDISTVIESVNENIQSSQSVQRAGGQLHVYVSGLSVPFLISGGSSEGWCTTTIRESNNYQVSSLKYAVTYNWPSDGVSLWYDYNNSQAAYRSPAWPSSALTNVSGTWTVNAGVGAFEAVTSTSALVNGFPVMMEFYDVSHMDGTHI